MEFSTAIGIGASVFTATSLIPQLVKLIKEKQSNGVSALMLIVLFAGIGLWVYYGILKTDWIIIISNSFALTVNLIIGILTWHYRPKKKKKQK